jgi:hypothetical protein
MTSKSGPEPVVCCRPWTDLGVTDRDDWAWQVLHQLSHSRNPFSAETFSGFARVDVRRGRELIESGLSMHWLYPLTRTVYVGRLRAHRR